MGDNFKIAIFIGLVAAILYIPGLKKGTKSSKEFMQGFITYLIFFTIIGFIAILLIGK